jgi:hypothetical protein
MTSLQSPRCTAVSSTPHPPQGHWSSPRLARRTRGENAQTPCPRAPEAVRGRVYGCVRLQPISSPELAPALNWFMRSPSPAAGSPRFTRAECRLACRGLLRLRIVGLRLCASQAYSVQSVLPGARALSWCTPPALAPLASSVRLSVLRAACLSGLGAALVLAPFAAPVRVAIYAACRRVPTWSSPRAGSACPLRARSRGVYRRFERPWGSPRDTACPLHARCSGACRRELTWCSRHAGTACLLHAPCSAAWPACLELTSNSPCAGSACRRRARCIAACCLQPP